MQCSVLQYVQCVAVCCSVLQCVAACCSVLQCVAVCCSVLQCVAEQCTNTKNGVGVDDHFDITVVGQMKIGMMSFLLCDYRTSASSVLQCDAVWCIVLQSENQYDVLPPPRLPQLCKQCVAECCGVLQCVAVCCIVLQCVAVCCSLLQLFAVRCSMFHSENRDDALPPLQLP